MDYEALLHHLRTTSSSLLEDVKTLVECESPSDNLDAVTACAHLVADLGQRLTGAEPEWRMIENRQHLLWQFGPRCEVLLVGHCDTVWPMGTLARWPFSVTDDRATGPGVFDMKAGLAQMFHALAALDDLAGVTVLVTTDEEIGSPTSRPLIEEIAQRAGAALVLEASAAGAVKTGRKGASIYQLDIHGKAAHAGLEPENGINATVEAAHQILAISALDTPQAGTSVTPSVISGGTTINTVPGRAQLSVDSRAATRSEQQRIDDALRQLAPTLPGARLEWQGGINRPPLEESSSMGLFHRAATLADTLGLAPLDHAAVGGGSDGNFTAGVGTPTLDGMGAVGEHAHAEGEWASVAAMPDRAALLAALIDSLQADPV